MGLFETITNRLVWKGPKSCNQEDSYFYTEWYNCLAICSVLVHLILPCSVPIV